MRVLPHKITTRWKNYRVWLATQTLVVAVTKPQELRGRDLGQTMVQICVPILAFVLVVGGGIGAAFTAPQPAVIAEAELTVQNIEVPATSELEVFELDDFEPEEYHSVAQYAENLEQYREAIRSLRPSKQLERNRQAQILGSLEVREWVALGTAGTEVCFQQSKTIECIESETLEALRESGKTFADANPNGFGLCYDWFDEVCMSGDWFDSKERFISVINASREYVMTGDWPAETSELALESSPTYEPARSTPVLQDDLMTESEWRNYAATLFPDRDVTDLIITYGFDAESYRGNPDDLAGVEQWYQDNPGAFCIGGESDGDCFTSRAEYEELLAWESRDRSGECSGSMTLNGGPEVCTHVWQGSPGNWTKVPIPYTYPDGYGWVDPQAPEPTVPNGDCAPGEYFVDGEGCWESAEHREQQLSESTIDNGDCNPGEYYVAGEGCWESPEHRDQWIAEYGIDAILR